MRSNMNEYEQIRGQGRNLRRCDRPQGLVVSGALTFGREYIGR